MTPENDSKWGMRNWKAVQADYNSIIANPLDTDGCCYCLQQNEIELIIVGLSVYRWVTRWTNSDDISQDTIDEFIGKLERKLMSDCCCDSGSTPDGSAPITRWELVNNEWHYQISYDGGDTYVEAPDSPIALAPVMPSPIGINPGQMDSKCDAAANGLDHIQDLVAAHSAAFDTAGTALEFLFAVIAVLLALALAPAAVPLIVPILIGATTAVFGIGKTAFDAYWTTEVYDTIQCALYCNMEDDGQFTDGGYAGFMSDIGTNLPASVCRDMIYRDFQAWGKKGLNNVCAYGIVMSGSDCSGCDCGGCGDWVYATVDGEPDGAFDGVIDTIDDHTVEFHSGSFNPSNSSYYVGVKKSGGKCCIIESVTTIEGGDPSMSFTPCPNDNNVDYAHLIAGGATLGDCVWALVMLRTAPFVVRVVFSTECEEE